MICSRCQREIPDDAVMCCYCGRVYRRKPPSRVHQRANGTGSAYKRGSTWTAVVTVGWYIKDGVKHRVKRYKGGFKTRTEALDYIPILKNGGVRKKAPSLMHYWDLYQDHEYHQLGDSKQMAYKIAWGKMTAIHYRPVDTLTVQDLRDVVSQKAHTYYPARDMKTVLKHIFKLAAVDRWVDKDLPEFIILPPLNEKEHQPFTDEEQIALWKAYDGGDRRAAIPLIMIYTGMMPGEMQNLELDMIDVDGQRIRGVGMKTKVRRSSPVYLPDIIMPVLIDEMQHATSKKGYVWARNERKFYENYYAVLEASGCRRLEPYSCRHTTATALAISKVIAPQTIKKIMRWSSTRMLDRYAHPDDAAAINALNTIERPNSVDHSVDHSEE